jgi:hypothetical protein
MRFLSLTLAVLALAALSAVPFGAGCSKTVTIHLKDGSVVEGKIEQSDEAYVHLENGMGIARKEIEDIWHPGSHHAIYGAISSLVGLGLSIYGVILRGNECGQCKAIGTMIAVAGIVVILWSAPLSIWGWSTYFESRSAASPPDESTRSRITPITLSDGERTYWGLGMSWSW